MYPNLNQKSFLEALLCGDKIKCTEISSKLINNNLNIKDLYEKIIKKSMYEIGDLWEFGKISVASEHLASAIVEANLNEQYYSIISKKTPIYKSVVTCCVENEFHQIGIKMVTDVFELNGWNTHFLGANTPSNELIGFVKKLNPNILAISMSIYLHIPQLEQMITDVQKELPGTTILIGGQGFRLGGQAIFEKYNNVAFLDDLYKLDTYLKAHTF